MQPTKPSRSAHVTHHVTGHTCQTRSHISPARTCANHALFVRPTLGAMHDHPPTSLVAWRHDYPPTTLGAWHHGYDYREVLQSPGSSYAYTEYYGCTIHLYCLKPHLHVFGVYLFINFFKQNEMSGNRLDMSQDMSQSGNFTGNVTPDFVHLTFPT